METKTEKQKDKLRDEVLDVENLSVIGSEIRAIINNKKVEYLRIEGEVTINLFSVSKDTVNKIIEIALDDLKEQYEEIKKSLN